MNEQQRIELWGIAQIAGSLSTLLNQWDRLTKDELKVEMKDLHKAIGLFGHALIKDKSND